MKKALFYKKLKNHQIQCQACNHYCLILSAKKGICGVRENIKGELYALTYGLACAENIDPIEKKPLFHFLPGSYSLSIATVGCNFRCSYCQNWDISQGPKINPALFFDCISCEKIKPIRKKCGVNQKIDGFELSPGKIIQDALDSGCQSISYTYTEPTVFVEYAIETMKLAQERGIKNVWVSNGYMSKKVLEEISPYLDAINIDLKSFKEKFYQEICGARLKPVLENLKIIKNLDIWLEITTLVIPGFNDSPKKFEQIAYFIKNELGDETPWHLSKFSPEISWQMQNLPPTPDKTIQKAREIGLEGGLKYVYTGNIRENSGENTYCPKCKTLNIKRIGFSIERLDKNGKCWKCGNHLNLIV
ncbi:MAG: pyruvate formate lyase activating enzyme [Parcubacteria group bacterium Athens1014_10]|nr:MAG: pyruvate formate lyase activating enzyme [Parcubacteria group bacterium Athens1014_10]TSD06035.1 MAG: pyruvate formate lyase activating enzyme [Parcubacteria group bacterium Athens0714_12]